MIFSTTLFAGVFRGKVWKNSDPLAWCVVIITRIVQMQTMLSPLRKHFELLASEDQHVIDEAAAAIRANVEYVDGLRIGRVIDIRSVDGNVRGPVMNAEDTEPSDAAIDSGYEFKDFNIGSALFVHIFSLSCRRQSIGVLVGRLVERQSALCCSTSRDVDYPI